MTTQIQPMSWHHSANFLIPHIKCLTGCVPAAQSTWDWYAQISRPAGTVCWCEVNIFKRECKSCYT